MTNRVTLPPYIFLMGKQNDWKERLGVVYSTNPDFNYEGHGDEEQETIPPSQQTLKISLSTRHRKGKTVTLISGFIGMEEDLKALEKILKSKCATGGSCKDGEIMLQGDFRIKAGAVLRESGYKVKGI